MKIDRSFVWDVDTDSNDTAIADTIIVMASGLSLNLVAEGVETHEQLEYLRKRGFQMFQGFYFSSPMPGDEFMKVLAASV